MGMVRREYVPCVFGDTTCKGGDGPEGARGVYSILSYS